MVDTSPVGAPRRRCTAPPPSPPATQAEHPTRRPRPMRTGPPSRADCSLRCSRWGSVGGGGRSGGRGRGGGGRGAVEREVHEHLQRHVSAGKRVVGLEKNSAVKAAYRSSRVSCRNNHGVDAAQRVAPHNALVDSAEKAPPNAQGAGAPVAFQAASAGQLRSVLIVNVAPLVA